jgi:hypothetical protein
LGGHFPNGVENNKLRKPVQNGEYGRVTLLGTGQRPHKINKQPVHGSGRWLSIMQTHACVLRRFSPLTQVAFADILKNVISHLRPSKIGCDFIKRPLSAQMTCQRYIMEVLEQHRPEKNRDNPSPPFCPLRKEAQQALMYMELVYRTLT